MVVEKVTGVEHVKEVELGVDGDGGLHPGHVGRRTLLDCQLLQRWKRSDISMAHIQFYLG